MDTDEVGLRMGSLLRSYRYGLTLPQHFYMEDWVYRADLELLASTQWLLIDHASRIPNARDYFLADVGTESIIVVRDRRAAIRAFYNVCRHRGSRVCRESSGHLESFICPYHAWTYGLDGELRAAPSMPPQFDKKLNGLKPCHVRVESGLIFLSLAGGTPPDFDAFLAKMRRFLAPHGLADAEVAIRKRYPTRANWKLVVENFLECYHCRTAHRTYCAVHDAEKLLAFGAGPGSSSPELIAKYTRQLEAWEAEARAKGWVTGMFGDGAQAPFFQSASRLPIGPGHVTETLDGKPVAPLMGSFTEYDGAKTAIAFNPLGFVMASNDFAALLRFTPRGPLETDVDAIWLVRAGARESHDYDTRRLSEVWDVTLVEDRVITENNQQGVLSSQYEPGTYSQHETRVADFGAWYVGHMDKVCSGIPSDRLRRCLPPSRAKQHS
jgi:Rieske 2Fe-2S family protein